MQEQPELISGGLAARSSVGGEVGFPGLDVVLSLSAPAVEVLVERTSAAVAEVGDDEAGIGALTAGLDAGDDAADPAPAAGGVKELLEAADLAIARRGLEAGRGARLEVGDMPAERAGRDEAEDVVEALRLAPVEDLRAGVVAVGAQQNLHLRPGGADRPHQAAQKGTDFDALRPFRRAQDGGDEAALAIEDDDRLEAVVVVMGVEQPTASKVSSMSRVIRRGTWRNDP